MNLTTGRTHVSVLCTCAIIFISQHFGIPMVSGVMVKTRPVKSLNNSKTTFTSPANSRKAGLLGDTKSRLPHSPCQYKSCRIEDLDSDDKPKLGNGNSQWSPKGIHYGNRSNYEGEISEFVYDQEQEEIESDAYRTTSSSSSTSQINESESDEDSGVRPRLIRVNIPAAPPRTELKNGSSPIQSLYAKYPTIRLADFARKMIFPEWIWARLTHPPIIKKSEVTDTVAENDGPSARPADLIGFNDTFLPSTTTRKPKGILERPTITFDNNMSRFLKLFTVVRFQNVPCLGPNGENGTCYHARECSDLGGHATTPCAQGLGVCCLFFKTCGETILRNGTYFVSSGASFTRGVSTCNVNIQKLSPSIRQIRLDLHTFIMQPPNAGNCESDRFLVSGQNTNNIIPILCGNNSGSHLYIETGTSHNLIQLSVMTTGEGLRAWTIQINQIEEVNSVYSAPSHCLQYFEGTMGTINSFNYDSTLSPQYLNNLNYAICIRKEAGFCSVTYSNMVPDGQYFPFQIVNADAQGNLLLPSGHAGLGIRNCPDDYILINGIRLCGERLNDASKSTIMMDDTPVTDTSNGPFTVFVHTNEIDVGGGFTIYYRQNPCMSTAG